MIDNWIKSELVFVIVTLFLGAGVVSAFDVNPEDNSKPLNLGNWLYVGGSGPGNYTKIQDAINDSVNGDTVFVYSNYPSYRENLIINVSINLIGEDKVTTIIIGDFSTVVHIYADGVSVSGFSIKFSGDSNEGIYVYSNYNNIYGNIFSDNGRSIHLDSSNYNTITDNILMKSKMGIYLINSHHNNITDNNISSNSVFGIWLDTSSSGNSINGNSIISNNDYCIRIYSSDNTIMDNTISNKKGDGIILGIGNNNTIINNTFLNGNGIAIRVGSNTNIITGNTISNNSYGIFLVGSDNNTVQMNTLSDNGGGVSISSSNNNIISDNSLFNNSFFVSGSYHNMVSNNTVNGKPLVYLEDESDKVIDYETGQIILINCSKITVENQKIADTDVGIELWNTDNSIIRNNDCLNKVYGIYLYGSLGNTITGNIITLNKYCAIYLGHSSDNNITGNILSKNRYGIRFSYSKFNTISGNTISNNEDGIYLGGYTGLFDLVEIFSDGSKNNNILKNNFLGNKRDAFFQNSFRNQWKQNYWNRSQILPKLIRGEIYWIEFVDFGIRDYNIPWIPQFDWRPTLKPYDLP